jgi:cytoskeleton protein RodZ
MSERPNTASASAGALLAAERQAQNLTIGDVSRHLKLAPAQVAAIEAGAYERLPGRVFVRGFLRNYAKLLGLEAEPLLRALEAELPPPVRIEAPRRAKHLEMPLEKRTRWLPYSAVAVLTVALLAVYEFGFNDAGAPPEAFVDTQSTGALAGSAMNEPVPFRAVEVAPSPAVLADGEADPARAPANAFAQAQSPLAGEAVAAAPAEPRAASMGERVLHFRFDQESWVEVRDREARVIFSRLNRPGTEERVSGTPPFRLVIGNARGVRLTSDERPVDLRPHISASVARFTLE